MVFEANHPIKQKDGKTLQTKNPHNAMYQVILNLFSVNNRFTTGISWISGSIFLV